jgi:hypothetical protein
MQCIEITESGTQCSRITHNSNGQCWQHQVQIDEPFIRLNPIINNEIRHPEPNFVYMYGSLGSKFIKSSDLETITPIQLTSTEVSEELKDFDKISLNDNIINLPNGETLINYPNGDQKRMLINGDIITKHKSGTTTTLLRDTYQPEPKLPKRKIIPKKSKVLNQNYVPNSTDMNYSEYMD